MDHTEELQQAIAEYRTATSARRARSFVDCGDCAAGINVLPITPRTWTMLHATGNRLICGGQPMEGDVRNYLWFHSPLFTTGALARPLKWFALLRFSALLHRNKDEDWYCATLALITADLAAIVEEAVADAPSSGEGGAPGPCFEAQLIHIISAAYHWSPEYIREQPLRKLMQYVRCINPDDDDAGERRIKYAHLRKRNAAHLAAQPV